MNTNSNNLTENTNITAPVNSQNTKLGTPFLIIGYTSFCTLVLLFTFLYLFNSWRNWLWTLVPVISAMLILLHRKKMTGSFKPIKKELSILWIFIGILSILIFYYPIILIHFTTYTYKTIEYNSYNQIILIMSLGLLSTALIIKRNAIIYCAITGFILSFTQIYLELYLNYRLIFGLFLFLLMIIPGYIMNHSKKQKLPRN